MSRPGRKPRPPRQPRTDADDPKQTEVDRRDIRQTGLDGHDTTGHMDRLCMRKCVRTFLHGVAIANRVSLKRPTSRRENNLRSPRTTGRGSSEEDPQVRFLLPSSAGRRRTRGHPVTHWLPRDADPTRIRLCACAPHPLGTLMDSGEVHSPPKGANLSHKTVRPPTSHAMTVPVRRLAPCAPTVCLSRSRFE